MADERLSNPAPFTAVVLAGGAGRRMGGVDKAMLTADGVTLLDRVLAAAVAATRTVVVGPPRRTARHVVWCREDPPGAGPAAGVAAALPLVATDLLVLLAVDLPWLTPSTIEALLAASTADGVQAVDADDRVQPLLAVYRTGALRQAAAAASPPGLTDAPLRVLTRNLALTRLAVDPWSARDVDTAQDRAALDV